MGTRVLTLGACATVTAALIVSMASGIGSRPWRVTAIVAACLATAVAVALLPDRWQMR